MNEPLYRFDRPRMGGILSISLCERDRERCRTAAEMAFQEVERLERMLTLFDPESTLCRMNRLAAERQVRVEPEMGELIAESLRCSRMTGGAFDITVNPLMRIWGFRGRVKRPSREEIEHAREVVGFEKLRCDPDLSAISYLRKGVEIDFGGIGKGFAVDRAVRVLVSNRIEQALVTFGSVSYAMGSPPGKPGWAFAVQDPLDPRRSLGSIRIRDRAISSSGDTHQVLRLGDEIVPHVIDPRTGYPALEIRGATVIHPSATTADALSTGLMVLGKEEMLSLLSDVPDLEGLVTIRSDGATSVQHASAGWNRYRIDPGVAGISRRRFVRTALLALGSFLITGRPLAASIESRAKETLRSLFPDGSSIHGRKIRLNARQMSTAHQMTGKRFRKETYDFFEIGGESEPINYAVILDVMGKERPITFLVVVDATGTVVGVEVLAYREAIGGEIRAKWFLDQFLRKRIDSPLKLGEDIQAISGATISSRATGYAVRKGLALVGAVYSPDGWEPAK